MRLAHRCLVVGGLIILLSAAAGRQNGRAEIIEITPGVTPPPVSLSQGEQQLLQTLMPPTVMKVVSDLSPDNRTLVLAVTDLAAEAGFRLKFLDVNTGDLRPFPDIALRPADLRAAGAPISITWQGNDIVRYVDPTAEDLAVVTLNLPTEISTRTTAKLPGEVISVSPDLRHVIVRVPQTPLQPNEPSFADPSRLLLISLTDLSQVELARLPEFWTVQSSGWSADATRIALAIVPLLSERDTRSPNSASLGSDFVRDALGLIPSEQSPFLQGNGVGLFDVTLPQPLHAVLRARDGDGALFASVALAPDGQRLVARMTHPARVIGRPFPIYGYPDRSSYRVYTFDGELLTTINAPEVAAPTESAVSFVGSDRAAITAAFGTETAVLLSDLSGGPLRRLPVPAGSVKADSLRASADGRTLFFLLSSVLQPPELFRMPLDGSRPPERVSNVNAAVAAVNRVRVDPVQFRVSTGERSGFLVQPAGAAFPPRQVPIVFWQLGGPGPSMRNQFAADVETPINLLPNFGLAVLVVPLAGREGLGPDTFRLMADGTNFGAVDMREAKEIADQLVERGWARRSQLGITGCSYGGYFASQTPALYPDAFAAANAQCSLHDVLTEWQIGYAPVISYLTGTTPLDDVQRFLQVSPLYNAHRIRTPMLLFHGTADFLPIDITRTFHDVLARNGVRVWLLAFEGEPHGLRKLSSELLAAQAQIVFFRYFLGASSGGE